MILTRESVCVIERVFISLWGPKVGSSLYLWGPTPLMGTKTRPRKFEGIFETENVVIVSGLP